MAAAADGSDSEMWGEPSLLSIELVLGVWNQFVTELSPWCAMPVDDRSGELRRVLEELLDPVGGIDSEARRRRIRGVATQHGIFRRAQRCSQSTISNDFVVLRRAIYRALRARGARQTTAHTIAHELAPDFHVALKAATRGYARLQGLE